ncbi:hypothetical protein CASFOL_012925 [Castilleja foliolosa]|uniref:Disease resistance N-terminal domain-containing protein n=1 Tax=Castilleja foliolosa TaxID=1961234 RepID=A0ABD3DII1_9LAMI
MEEILVSSIIQVVIEKLITFSLENRQENLSLVKNFKNDLDNLHRTFAMVNDVLHDAEKLQVTNSAVKRYVCDTINLGIDQVGKPSSVFLLQELNRRR